MYKYPILAHSKSIFYVHRVSMMAAHCTQHEQNPDSFHRYISLQTYKMYYIMNINAILAHSQGICYMHILWLITVPNITTNKTFKMNIITQIWHRAKLLFSSYVGNT